MLAFIHALSSTLKATGNYLWMRIPTLRRREQPRNEDDGPVDSGIPQLQLQDQVQIQVQPFLMIEWHASGSCAIAPPVDVPSPAAPVREYTAEQEAVVCSILASSNHNTRLNLNPTATIEELKKQYRKMALALHPDKNSHPDAVEAFKALQHSYECLLKAKMAKNERDQKKAAAKPQTPKASQPQQPRKPQPEKKPQQEKQQPKKPEPEKKQTEKPQPKKQPPKKAQPAPEKQKPRWR